MESKMHRAKFTIDDGPAFSGYSDGGTWNGWATPYFEFDAAQRILARYCSGLAHFDAQRDTFVIQPDPQNELSERDEVGATTIEIDGRRLKVYKFNTLDWTWDEVD
jgi:hypothetical protein